MEELDVICLIIQEENKKLFSEVSLYNVLRTSSLKLQWMFLDLIKVLHLVR